MADLSANRARALASTSGRPLFAMVGVICAGLATGVAELLSAIGQSVGWLHVSSSPVGALGDAFIQITPGWLERWAVAQFGLHDKQALLAGMALVAAAFAAVLGLALRGRPLVAGVLTFVLITLALVSVWTRPGTTVADGLPAALGSVIGMLALLQARRLGLTHSVGRLEGEAGAESLDGAHADAEPPAAGATSDAVSPDAVSPFRDGASPASDGAFPAGRPPFRRRGFLRFAAVGAVVALVSGVASRLIPSARDVEASRARIRLPDPSGRSGVPAASAAPPGASTKPPPSVTRPPATSLNPGTTQRLLPSAAPGSSTPSDRPTASEPRSLPSTSAQRPVLAPSAFDSIPGSTPYVTNNKDFYRVDTTLSPPLITAENWTLRVHGMVREAFTINYFGLRARPLIDRDITLACVSNTVGGHLLGNATWTGTPLLPLLRQAGLQPGADCLLSTSVDGFTCSTPLSAITDGRDAMLAIGMNGEPLPIEHGFPVRMVVPGLYGYVSATKWVVDLEVTSFSKVSAYWTARGWADHGPVRLSSRVDVPAPLSSFDPGDLVTFAGVAWAQHIGIAKVEVRVDNGPWVAAELAGTSTKDAWRQWRYRWTAATGRHLLTCRAIDNAGAVQDVTPRDPFPSGSTGYATLAFTVS